MPIYDYACDACNKTFEYLARTRDDAPQTCPACAGTALRKLPVSAFSATVKSPGACPSANAGGHGCCGGCCHGH